MATGKEIKTRIASIQNTLKITNTMYLVSSAKYNSALTQLNKFKDFSGAVEKYSSIILSDIDETVSIYTDNTRQGIHAYLVIGSNKGLAGDYNKQIAKRVKEIFKSDENCKIYVAGSKLKSVLHNMNVPTARHFDFDFRNPDDESAQYLADFFDKKYTDGEIARLSVVFAEMQDGMNRKVKTEDLLPVPPKPGQKVCGGEFVNTKQEIIDTMMSLYIKTLIRSALINGYCSEQNARMTAMQSASDNAKELLAELNTQYNHTRQASITREITEISGERTQL